MDRSVQGFRVRLAKAAALLVFVGSAAPQALAQLPGGSLIVTITSPGSCSTVANTVPVSASVSVAGSLTVASVQFKLDGANLSALDTSAPYSVSSYTTAVGNGSPTLSSGARASLPAPRPRRRREGGREPPRLRRLPQPPRPRR